MPLPVQGGPSRSPVGSWDSAQWDRAAAETSANRVVPSKGPGQPGLSTAGWGLVAAGSVAGGVGGCARGSLRTRICDTTGQPGGAEADMG